MRFLMKALIWAFNVWENKCWMKNYVRCLVVLMWVQIIEMIKYVRFLNVLVRVQITKMITMLKDREYMLSLLKFSISRNCLQFCK